MKYIEVERCAQCGNGDPSKDKKKIYCLAQNEFTGTSEDPIPEWCVLSNMKCYFEKEKECLVPEDKVDGRMCGTCFSRDGKEDIKDMTNELMSMFGRLVGLGEKAEKDGDKWKDGVEK